MDLLLDLVREYGAAIYALLFAYCALKSGALPLLAGYAAQTGALEMAPVVAVTFLGGYLGDELRFALARRYGDRLAVRFPRFGRVVVGARALMDHYGVAYVFLYRYPKGMRTIGAFPLGLGALSWTRFTALNAASAALWTILLTGAGYLFGSAIERAVQRGWTTASIVALVVFLGIAYLAWRRLRRLSVVPAAMPE